MGLIISFFQLNQYVGLTVTKELLTQIAPEIFFTIFLPGLLFEGAMNLGTEDLFENIKSISAFAIIGVLLSVFVAGSVLHFILNVPWNISLLIAAMIVPTDPIAVLSIFKKQGVPKKLAVLLEGESLFNDGTGIVIFRVILGLILTGTFSLGQGVLEFIKVVLGGLIIGLFLGYLISKIISKIEDNFIQITLTTILAYGSFLVAEHMHLSGVISVVVSGLIVGELGIKKLSAESKLEIKSFWTYAGFLLNSFVFLLIGLELNVQNLLIYFIPIVIAFIAVLFGRAISMYFISHIINKVDDSKLVTTFDEYIPLEWQHVLVWGGLHGGLSMVLALSLPSTNMLLVQWRPFIITTVFGVVFMSLLLQGTTISFLLIFLGISKKKEIEYNYDLEQARQYMYMSAEKELESMKKSRMISKKLYSQYLKVQRDSIKKTERKLAKLIDKHPSLKEEQVKEIENTILMSHKNALIEGYKKGHFSKEVMNELIKEVNHKLVQKNEHKTKKL